MATVYEKDLIPRLSREVGDTDTSNLYYTANMLFSYLNDGLEEFNEDMPQRYSITGTGDSAYYTPEPADIDKRLLVLYAARALMRGEMAKQVRQAIVHSNPAGRTDMTRRPVWTDAVIKHYDRQIARYKLQRERYLVEEQLKDDGAMELKNDETTGTTTWVEGLPITKITTSV
jgi:hypothetical protein